MRRAENNISEVKPGKSNQARSPTRAAYNTSPTLPDIYPSLPAAAILNALHAINSSKLLGSLAGPDAIDSDQSEHHPSSEPDSSVTSGQSTPESIIEPDFSSLFEYLANPTIDARLVTIIEQSPSRQLSSSPAPTSSDSSSQLDSGPETSTKYGCRTIFLRLDERAGPN
jgi:hypothetical protein